MSAEGLSIKMGYKNFIKIFRGPNFKGASLKPYIFSPVNQNYTPYRLGDLAISSRDEKKESKNEGQC